MKKRVLSFLLALTLLGTLGLTALASVADIVFYDVAADAWYADAAEYVQEHGLMSGTSATTFSPNTTTSRAMLATILYRRAGSPTAGLADFSDVPVDAWYARAAGWAAGDGIVSGYSDGRFGPNDPVTREQLATILWRSSGSSAATDGRTFADQGSIAAYAAPGVAWAREQGIVSGREGNRFEPKGNATRAELAVMLHRWLDSTTPNPPETPNPETSTLVAYFSSTGSTQTIAQTLAEHLDADLYAITPAQPYTTADLNYSNSSSRSIREQNNPAARPALGGEALNLEGYDTIFLGYPIWLGQAPKILSTFLERHDFDGKTIVPFCTSGSSGMGSSANNLHSLASGADWMEGRRFDRGVASTTVTGWADGLLQQTPAPTPTPTPTPTPDQEEDAVMPRLTIQVGSSSFTATLEDNETTRAMVERLPMTVSMGELNGNEKYYYLPSGLPTNSQRPGTLHTGDLMLYGSDCLVLFYETFTSGYSYTRLGSVEDPAGLAAALGRGSVSVTFRAD